MTAVSREKIYAKLENFREYYGYLEQLKKEISSEKEFVSDFHLFGNVERYLQLSIQAIMDITHLLIIELDQKRPQDNYDAISILHEAKVIDEHLAEQLTGMVGLRNVLVHQYGKIDRRQVYKVLQDKLPDIRDFQKQIVKYLEGQ